MRAVLDQHVDRPGVEAQRCVELTGTNCSIGLIVKSMCDGECIAPPMQCH